MASQTVLPASFSQKMLSAKHYGLSGDAYKKNNIPGTGVTSRNVADWPLRSAAPCSPRPRARKFRSTAATIG